MTPRQGGRCPRSQRKPRACLSTVPCLHSLRPHGADAEQPPARGVVCPNHAIGMPGVCRVRDARLIRFGGPVIRQCLRGMEGQSRHTLADLTGDLSAFAPRSLAILPRMSLEVGRVDWRGGRSSRTPGLRAKFARASSEVTALTYGLRHMLRQARNSLHW